MIPKRIPKTYATIKETEEPNHRTTSEPRPSIRYGDSFSRSVAAIQPIDKNSVDKVSCAETAVAQKLHDDINESFDQSIEVDINIDDRSMYHMPTDAVPDAVPSHAFLKLQTHRTLDVSEHVCRMIREYINDDTLSIEQKISQLTEIKTFCQYMLEERYGVK